MILVVRIARILMRLLNIPIYDDDEEISTPLRDIIISELPPCVDITPILSTKEPKDSLIIGEERLDTIPKKESDEFIKFSVENLVPSPSESEDISDEIISTRVNPIQIEVLESITSIPPGIDYFDTESNLTESLLNRNTSIDSTSKIVSLLDEFTCELIFLKSIPPGIDEADFDPEEEICFVERLLYDNLSPRPSKEFNFENSDDIIESFSPSPILVEDSDSLIEEIDLFLTSDDSMPPGIENDDYDSEGDFLFLKELLINDSPSFPKNESFRFDVPSYHRPPAKPPDDDEIKPDMRVLTVKVVGDIFEHYVLMPRLYPTQPTLCPVIDTLLPFSSKNKDKVSLLSHRGFKIFLAHF
nr:hypothetical protein [Tanacetum cinerariifolium]